MDISEVLQKMRENSTCTSVKTFTGFLIVPAASLMTQEPLKFIRSHVKNTVLFIIIIHCIDCPLMIALAKFKYSAIFHLCCARF